MTPKNPGSSRRILIWTAVTVAIVIGLPAAIIFISRYRAERAWQIYRADAIARGELLDFDQPQFKPVPPEDNFADLPIFRRAAADDSYNPLYLNSHLASELERSLRSKADDLQHIRGILVAERLLSSERADELDGPALVLASLESFEPDLSSVRAALNRKHADFSIHGKRPDPWGMDVFPSRIFSSITQQFALLAYGHVAAGSGDLALAEVEALCQLARHEAAQPLVAFFEVSHQIASRLCPIIHEGLSAGVWSESDLARIEAILPKPLFHESETRRIRAKRLITNIGIDAIFYRERVPARSQGTGF